MTENELLEQLEHQVTIGTGQVTPLRLAAAAHIRAQSAEIAWLKMGLSLYASDMAQFYLPKTRTALKEPDA